jgi:enamine deaminase RidA (YjgF/YER057c/UK114 family)
MRSILGTLDRVSRIVKVFGTVNAADDFMNHPAVINGCSDLLVEVFGENGRHARSAIGVSSLAGGITLEVEAILAVRLLDEALSGHPI